MKRRINARNHRFFAVCAPGLEPLCLRELKALSIHQDMPLELTGGVAFSGGVDACFAANLFLRSASRILMRIAAFKAENFRTLEKKLRQIPWELYIKKGADLEFDVSTHHSRLYHTGAIASRSHEIISEYFSAHGPDTCYCDKTACHKIFMRGTDDSFEVSMDSSGLLLHKRGVKQNVGAAPLRETLAFFLLDSAGYSGDEPLLDPMCGSGTFSLEAAMLSRGIPPGFYRDFAFFHWPCFRSRQWRFMKKEASSLIVERKLPGIFASDLDAAMLHSLKQTIEKFNMASSVRVAQTDFFDIKPKTLTPHKGLVVLNPPYGRRIGDAFSTASLFKEIRKKLQSDFKGWRACIILPDKQLLNVFPSSQVRLCFVHGGLELNAVVIKV